MAHPDTDHEPLLKSGRWQEALQAYLASIAYTDMNLSRLLDAPEQSAYGDNTLVFLWGNHGWHLGEKHHWRKFALWKRDHARARHLDRPQSDQARLRLPSPRRFHDDLSAPHRSLRSSHSKTRRKLERPFALGQPPGPVDAARDHNLSLQEPRGAHLKAFVTSLTKTPPLSTLHRGSTPTNEKTSPAPPRTPR